MSRPEITDEMLVAFADNEADEATAELIAQELERDEVLALRLEAFAATRQVLKEHFAPVEREAVPDKLLRFVMSGGKAEPPARPAGRSWAGLPVAAALAGIVAGSLGYWAMSGPVGIGDEIAAFAAAQPRLSQALDAAADGGKLVWQAQGHRGEVEIRQSYRTRDGYCRSFGLDDAALPRGWAGVACRENDGWHVRIAAAALRESGAVTPASGGNGAIDGFLDANEAGSPLDETAVREQISRGWR